MTLLLSGMHTGAFLSPVKSVGKSPDLDVLRFERRHCDFMLFVERAVFTKHPRGIEPVEGRNIRQDFSLSYYFIGSAHIQGVFFIFSGDNCILGFLKAGSYGILF